MLSPKIQSEILFAYHSENKSIRKISREFEINRKSVYRVIKRGKVLIKKSYSERGSIVDEYAENLEKLVNHKDHLSIKSIFIQLRGLGFSGGYSTVRNHVLEIRKNLNLNNRPNKNS